MSILIKGMAMPKCCDECPFRSEPFVGEVSGAIEMSCFVTKHIVYPTVDGYPDDCPLVELPPHGRLTKRLVYRGEVYNALEAERVNSLVGILTDPYKDGFHDGLKRALQILANEVEDAPTIIESEEEDG